MSLKHKLVKQGCTEEIMFLISLFEKNKRKYALAQLVILLQKQSEVGFERIVILFRNVLASVQQRAQAHPIGPGPILAQAYMGLAHRAQAQMGLNAPCAAVCVLFSTHS